MQDKIILGLLLLKDMTAYDVKKAIEKSTAFFYNASMGSIHPALKKLDAAKNISAENQLENGRAKKLYRITDSGRAVFSSWLEQGISMPKFKDETLVKVFFQGHLTAAQQKQNLLEYIAEIDQQIKVLELIQQQSQQVDVPANMESHAVFQLATLDYGLQYCRFTRNWYQDFVDRTF